MKKLKEQYKGLIITKHHHSLGDITFDANNVDPDKYDNYIALGFEELFEDADTSKLDITSFKYEGVEDNKPSNKKKGK